MKFAIITVSDRSAHGERLDESGPALAERVASEGWEVAGVEVLPDDQLRLAEVLSQWADSGKYDVILTTGGTGFALRDVTPEATRAVTERRAPGIPEAMRAASLRITPHAMLSRLEAGLRKRTLIINLPGSPQGAVENLEVVIPVLPHAVALLRGDAGAEWEHRKV